VLDGIAHSKAKKKILIWSAEQYTIGENKMSSGVALLKIIIRESHFDTNATTNQIQPNQALQLGRLHHNNQQ
jgi:hypothetical protein